MEFWKDVGRGVVLLLVLGAITLTIALVEYAGSARTTFMHIAVYHDQDRPLEPCLYRSFKNDKAFFDFLNKREIKDGETMHYYFHAASNRRSTAHRFRRQYAEQYPDYFQPMPPQDVWEIQDYWKTRTTKSAQK